MQYEKDLYRPEVYIHLSFSNLAIEHVASSGTMNTNCYMMTFVYGHGPPKDGSIFVNLAVFDIPKAHSMGGSLSWFASHFRYVWVFTSHFRLELRGWLDALGSREKALNQHH
jgi:hypothetical protein